MRALTLRHPWPWAILRGKDVENRTWEPAPSQLRLGERFAVHGGRVPKSKAERMAAVEDGRWIARRFPELVPLGMKIDEAFCPGVVAVVTFGGIVETSTSPWFTGPKGWILRDLIALPEPVPCGGAQGLWELPGSVMKQVEEQLRRAEA